MANWIDNFPETPLHKKLVRYRAAVYREYQLVEDEIQSIFLVGIHKNKIQSRYKQLSERRFYLEGMLDKCKTIGPFKKV